MGLPSYSTYGPIEMHDRFKQKSDNNFSWPYFLYLRRLEGSQDKNAQWGETREQGEWNVGDGVWIL